ncbi:MAG: hypothetical protein LBK94_02810, partial [Prevotellaceae bacterium]|nr:hypothetical protein [Prevotellaceae bacterium]
MANKKALIILFGMVLFFPFNEKLCAQAQITDADLPYSYNREDAAFSQVSLSKIIAEKTYPDNTKIGYFEINNLLSDAENAVMEQELTKNQKILRFQTFPSQTGIQYMFKADRSFSADSVVFYMNNVLANMKRGAYDNIPIKASETVLPPPVAFDMRDDCIDAAPFCTDNKYQFPAATDVAGLGRLGCLVTTPNPAWYWMQIDDPGYLEITITSHYDVDFIAWGPFTDLNDACQNFSPACPVDCPNNTSGDAHYPYGDIADCSYDRREFEVCHIYNAQHGEVYLLLITNFSNNVTNINFQQTGGEASTNCGIVTPPVTNNGPLCEGDSLLLTVTSPVAGAAYSWTGPNGWTSAQQNPVIYNVTTADAGTYTLVISANGEVGDPETTDVVISTYPVAAISPDSGTVTCSQSVTLTASGGVTYSWSNGSSVVGNSAELVVADAGTYTVTVTNEGGCSDTAVITVNSDTTSYMFVEIDSICASLTPYIWRSNQYNTTGVYYDSLIAVNGCDSIFTLNLTVNPSYHDTISASICFGDTYTNPTYAFLDTTPTAPGLIAWDTTLYTIIGGCDSTVRLELTVLPVYDTLITDTICFGDTYTNPTYAFLDTTPTVTGLLTMNTTLYTIIGGCDSTVRLNLTVLPVYDTLIIDTICFGDTYINPTYAFLDTTPTMPGLIAWDTTLYTIIGGCDSTVRLELTVLPVYNDTITASICLDETYSDYGFNEKPAYAGNYTFV